MNLSVLLVCFTFFSFRVSLSSATDPVFIAPVLFLAILNFKNLFEILKSVLKLNIFIILVVLSLVLYGEYALAKLIFIRSNLIILFGRLAFYRSDYFSIALAVSSLNLGDKLTAIFYFSAKFTADLKTIFIRLKKTLKVRGFEPKASLFTYKIYANLVAMLFLEAFYKASVLEKTFVCRGFDGKLYGDKSLKIGAKDAVIIALTACCYIFSLGVLI